MSNDRLEREAQGRAADAPLSCDDGAGDLLPLGSPLEERKYRNTASLRTRETPHRPLDHDKIPPTNGRLEGEVTFHSHDGWRRSSYCATTTLATSSRHPARGKYKTRRQVGISARANLGTCMVWQGGRGDGMGVGTGWGGGHSFIRLPWPF